MLIFDEVDAGIGGRNAGALGERLRALAAFHQVLCVTHLPQVAAYADLHLHVGKRVEEGRTFTEARALTGEERAAELAAMLAGEGAGDEARATAEALLRAAGPREGAHDRHAHPRRGSSGLRACRLTAVPSDR